MIMIIISLITSLLFFLFFDKIVKKINIYDYPDGIRKFQKNNIPCIGGVYFYVIFFLIFTYFLFFSQQSVYLFETFLIQTNKEFALFFLSLTSLFLIGLYDDKYQIEAKVKTFLLLGVIFFFVYHAENFQIKEIRFALIDREILLGNLSIFFTSICIFSFLVASNMFDGSNGQSFLNFLSILVFLFYKGLFFDLSILMMLMLFCFAVYNFKNLAYLGDNGVYLFSFILAYLIVKNYNLDRSIYAEEILIILLIPILDMLRLFVYRTMLGNNPFMPDAKHLHHIIQKKFGEKKLIYFLILIIMLPLSVLIFLDISHYFILLFQFLIYMYLVFIKKNKVS